MPHDFMPPISCGFALLLYIHYSIDILCPGETFGPSGLRGSRAEMDKNIIWGSFEAGARPEML